MDAMTEWANTDPAKTAVIVVDMQNIYVHPEGSFGKIGRDVTNLRVAIPGCVDLVTAAREQGRQIVYIVTHFRDDYRDGGRIFNIARPQVRDVGGGRTGSWDVQVIDELTPHASDLVVHKRRYSGFFGTNLDSLLRGNDVTSVAVCGVTTNICVGTTARDAAQHDYATFVASDATAELQQSFHEGALETLKNYYCSVVSVEDLVGV